MPKVAPKNAVTLLLRRHDGKVLSVSRGLLKPNSVGLPGGKVEKGELFSDAIIREVWEETGVIIADAKPVFSMLSAGDRNFYTTTYMAGYSDIGAIRRWTPEGWVRWVEPAKLVAGPFGVYNEHLLNHLGIDY